MFTYQLKEQGSWLREQPTPYIPEEPERYAKLPPGEQRRFIGEVLVALELNQKELAERCGYNRLNVHD